MLFRFVLILATFVWASHGNAAAVKKVPLSAKTDDFKTYIIVKIVNHTNQQERVRVGDADSIEVPPQKTMRKRINVDLGRNYVVSNKAQCFLVTQEVGGVHLIDVYDDKCTAEYEGS